MGSAFSSNEEKRSTPELPEDPSYSHYSEESIAQKEVPKPAVSIEDKPTVLIEENPTIEEKKSEPIVEKKPRDDILLWNDLSATWQSPKQFNAFANWQSTIAYSLSKKWCGMSRQQQLIYHSLHRTVKQLFAMDIPHDLLLIIVLGLLQGFKFAPGDHVIAFPNGVFEPGNRGKVKAIKQNPDNPSESYYLVNMREMGPNRRIPLHHIFSDYMIPVTKTSDGQWEFAENPLRAESAFCRQERKWSEKKQRKIQTLAVYFRFDDDESDYEDDEDDEDDDFYWPRLHPSDLQFKPSIIRQCKRIPKSKR